MNSSIARAISSPKTARIAAFGVSPPSDFSGAELMLSNDWATYSSVYSSTFLFFEKYRLSYPFMFSTLAFWLLT